MKKVLIIICVLVLVAAGIYLFNYSKPVSTEFSSTEGVTTVLTLEEEVLNDTIWCGTFQLIWNDLKNDLAKQDIVFTPQLPVVENLNKETFRAEHLSEESYYKTLGRPMPELKTEIENAILQKFNETSDILDLFDFENRNPEDYFLYTMLKKEFEFETPFDIMDKDYFGNYPDINYFGIEEDNFDKLANQIEVLYYNSEEDFAIKLDTKQIDDIIISKGKTGNTFNEIYKNILTQQKEYQGNKSLIEGEQFKIPNIQIKELSEFEELYDNEFYFSNGAPYTIEKALQTIEFELDNKGGKIKSEAAMFFNSSAAPSEATRYFLVDNTFTIFLKEQDKDVPYFAAYIDDITKFQ